MSYQDARFMIKCLTLGLITPFFLSSFYRTDPLKESMKRGEMLYASYCLSCHLDQGQGIANIYPPLAKSDYLMENKERSIAQVLHGATGEIVVNKVTYNNNMPGFPLNNEQVADILNYVRNSWGNEGDVVTMEEVQKVRMEFGN